MASEDAEVKESLLSDNAEERKKTIERRPDIQGLRGLAITYVVIYHLYPKLFSNGFLGLDISFVISGYLITMVLWNQQPITLAVFLNFYKKRIKRIFPAYYTMILLVLLFAFFFLTIRDYSLLKRDTIWAALFATNIHENLQGLNHSAEISSYDFLLHTWPLAVEIQFYFLAPAFVLFFTIPYTGKALWSVTFLVSIYCSVATTGPFQLYSLASRMWQFICGGIAFHSGLKCTWLLIAALITLSPFILMLSLEEVVLRLLITSATMVVVSSESSLTNEYILGNSFMRFIGDISYSVYLYHWPLILFGRYLAEDNTLNFRGEIVAVQFLVILGVVSYWYVEKKFIQWNFSCTLWLLAVLGSLICVGFVIPKTRERQDLPITSDSAWDFRNENATSYGRRFFRSANRAFTDAINVWITKQ
ncbi:unnamed protein product [Enterobius vermicularis]|uniref:Acyl_transf_3 domain-containing protein n=1 Tax=Enterobius vermicularis TaxID=51028 RepID=A0A0N4V9M4_ENTVE|nr:unnamed protein product [Enterobius vermicularis]